MTKADDKRSKGGISEELRPYVDRSHAKDIDRIGERMLDAKPEPTLAFRTQLYAHLSAGRLEPPSWRPERPLRLALAYAGSGFLLLAIAAIGLSGAGPLAY